MRSPAKLSFFRENLPMLLGLAVTAASVTLTGIFFHQSFWRILPLYVSMAVALLQSRMNRYASLLGSVNSLVYAAVYFYYRLYASAAYALLVSCPVQAVTFVRWSKKPWGRSTVFRKLSRKARLLLLLGAVLAEGILLLVLFLTGGSHTLLDSSITLIGIVTALLTMLSYIEYAPLMVLNGILSILLYIMMLGEHPEQTTYLCFTLYSLASSTIAFFRIRKLYAKQQAAAASPGSAGDARD
ncbi:MAG: nicotinamide mononucleotide transporter [Clostridia bacterium]|nr:nicotinamide mononucleotide transporter [Clostridia bacterium]